MCERGLLWWETDRTQVSSLPPNAVHSFYSITYVVVSVSLEPFDFWLLRPPASCLRSLKCVNHLVFLLMSSSSLSVPGRLPSSHQQK